MSTINVNSLCSLKKRLDLQKYLDEYRYDIVTISETKLNNKYKLKFNNYDIIRSDRAINSYEGGTAIAIKNNIKYVNITQPKKYKIIEYSAVRIMVNTNKSLLIFGIYATQSSKNTFITELDELFKDFKLDDNDLYFIIAGDLNARNTYWEIRLHKRQRQRPTSMGTK